MAENEEGNKDQKDNKKENAAPPPESGSKISNTEWGIVIGALLLIDLIQIALDLVAIGIIANTFIDILVGMAWPTYLHLRGVNLKSVKMFGSILLTFVFETIPVLNALPLWFLDGIVVFLLVKAEERIKEETGVDVGKIAAVAESGEVGAAAEETVKTDENAGAAEEGGVSDEYADAMGQESDAAEQEKESDNPYGDESEDEKSERMKGEEWDKEHEISDEETDELGKESDRKLEDDEGKKDDQKDKDKKKKPEERQGGSGLFGGERPGSGPSGSRNKNRYRSPEEKAEDERLSFHSNLLDLSDPYAARKKKENEER